MSKKHSGRPQTKGPTPAQGRALKYIKKHIAKYLYSPTLSDIGGALGMSRQSAGALVEQLEKKGYLKRKAGQPRTITLTKKAKNA